MSAAASAAKQTIKNVATASKSSTKTTAPKLFTYRFDPIPTALHHNIIYTATRQIASDPSHPFHIRTRRRLENFDPSKLYWTVKTPVELSKKAVVRRWAVRRVKEAFRASLRERGYAHDGTLLSNEVEGKDGLKGALGIQINGRDKEKAILTASGEDVKKECSWMVERIVKLQQDARPLIRKSPGVRTTAGGGTGGVRAKKARQTRGSRSE